MSEFPWEAVITGIAGLSVAMVPFFLAMPLDARIKATISALDGLDKESKAAKNLTKTLNLHTAKKYALSEHGAFRFLYPVLSSIFAFLLAAWQAQLPLTTFQLWQLILSGIATIIMIGYSYNGYLNVVKAHK